MFRDPLCSEISFRRLIDVDLRNFDARLLPLAAARVAFGKSIEKVLSVRVPTKLRAEKRTVFVFSSALEASRFKSSEVER